MSDARPRVVVGVDGSAGARLALLQALVAAARRGADLDVVATFRTELVYVGGAPLDVPDEARIRDDLRERARALVEEVREDATAFAVPGLREVGVRLVVAEGPAAQVLLEQSADADLLVVGSRGRGAMRSALLGSVALHCVTHARCPVIVVHPTVGVPPSPRIVVGIDGSDAARAALAAAVDEAARAGGDVEVVVAYAVEDYWTDLTTVWVPSVEKIRADLRVQAEQQVAAVLAERESEGRVRPPLQIGVVQGPAAEVLVDRARIADLLVVGSRGRGALRGLLLGSVALHCAMHAACPVMVVHPEPAAAAAPRVAVESAPAEH